MGYIFTPIPGHTACGKALPKSIPILGRRQSDQKVRLFFNIWPFATLKSAQQCHKFAKVGLAFPQIRKPVKILAKTCKILSKCRILVKLVGGCMGGGQCARLTICTLIFFTRIYYVIRLFSKRS